MQRKYRDPRLDLIAQQRDAYGRVDQRLLRVGAALADLRVVGEELFDRGLVDGALRRVIVEEMEALADGVESIRREPWAREHEAGEGDPEPAAESGALAPASSRADPSGWRERLRRRRARESRPGARGADPAGEA